MIQANELPLCEVLDSSLFAEAFQEDKVVFGIADEDVVTPAITLWAMVSQFLFKQEGRSCKAAAGRAVSLLAQIAGRVVAQNAGNYCRAKAKIPIATIRKITLRLASQAEIGCLEFDYLTTSSSGKRGGISYSALRLFDFNDEKHKGVRKAQRGQASLICLKNRKAQRGQASLICLKNRSPLAPSRRCFVRLHGNPEFVIRPTRWNFRPR